jgi:hypothetical protein
MNKKALEVLQADIDRIRAVQPGLRLKFLKDVPVEIFGTYVVRDHNGKLQGDFEIRVIIPAAYPHGFPSLFETSDKIERIADRHIDKEGLVCEEFTRAKTIIASKGLTLERYFNEWVNRYFCWQLLYEEEGMKHLEQWSHNARAIVEFYQDFLKLQDENDIVRFLKAMTEGTIGRNDLCPCGQQRKLKACHAETFTDLKRVPKKQLLKDLSIINEMKKSG